MSCESPHTIHTIGHSTRTIGVLIKLLQAHDIEMVVDVRRWPASRRLPHFNRESLTTELKTAGIDYLWRGDTHAAELAYILYQVPVLIAVHGAEMLTKPGATDA